MDNENSTLTYMLAHESTREAILIDCVFEQHLRDLAEPEWVHSNLDSLTLIDVREREEVCREPDGTGSGRLDEVHDQICEHIPSTFLQKVAAALDAGVGLALCAGNALPERGISSP